MGNPTSYYNGNRWTFTWAQGRRLTNASDGTNTVSYTYDADGLRTGKTVNGTEHTHYYAGGRLLRETFGNNTLDFFYDSNGNAYAVKYNGVLYYYITNLQGDVMSIVDETGTPVAAYEYDPYGNILTATGDLADVNPLCYRGYIYDTETKLYYLQSRYYDPEVGRFLNADAFASTGQGILGNNMFAYCGNCPNNNIDRCGAKYEEDEDKEKEQYRFVGIGFQGELNVGSYEKGIEIIVYFDPLVCDGQQPVVAVYSYEGAFVDLDDFKKNPYFAKTIAKLTLAITTNAVDEQNAEALLIALQAALFNDVGLSGSIVGIFANDDFRSTESYCGAFDTFSATVKHVKITYSWSPSCRVIAVGGSSSSYDISYGQSYYTKIY